MSEQHDTLAEIIAKDRAALKTKSLRKGHQQRFLAKLEASENKKELASSTKKTSTSWMPWTVAASILILVLSGGLLLNNNTDEAQELPEEIANAEFYFEGLINGDLEKLEAAKSEHTTPLINDTVSQIKVLDQEYKILQEKLIENYDRRIVKAMISNFQTRIELLTMVLDQIEIIEQIKNEQQNENNYL